MYSSFAHNNNTSREKRKRCMRVLYYLAENCVVELEMIWVANVGCGRGAHHLPRDRLLLPHVAPESAPLHRSRCAPLVIVEVRLPPVEVLDRPERLLLSPPVVVRRVPKRPVSSGHAPRRISPVARRLLHTTSMRLAESGRGRPLLRSGFNRRRHLLLCCRRRRLLSSEVFS